MDVRPFRPRGVENILPSLHQRHKSTGNIAEMASKATTGFRGPAKRAAFGDVTNLAKNAGAGRDGAKVMKTQAFAAVNHAQAPSIVNKENVVYPLGKDALSRPARRPALSAIEPKLAAEEPPAELAVTAQTSLLQVQETVEHAYNSNLVVGGDDTAASAQDYNAAVSAQIVTGAVPLQPRHHKSQPQLKALQPTLRRTQSRQLEKTFLPSEPQLVSSHEPTDMPLHNLDHIGAHATHFDSVYLPTDQGAPLEVDQVEQSLQLPTKLPGISEEAAVVSTSAKEGRTSALSEPEEYWDEDEDDYEDQDQAYTTAHSFRSRDQTTGGVTTLLQPRVTTRVQRELEEAKIEVEHTRSPDDVDEEAWDVSMVAEYGDEIFEYMRELEIRMLPNPHYMDIQTEIQWSMRSVLMDWLVQVHNRFCLLPETLFLTVNYIDRFLSYKVVSIGKLQLVGATALLVASKYEEINCPSLQEIVYMVDRGYSTDEILKAERFMLSMLSFELGWPGPMSFLRRVSKADDYDLETRTLAKYFLELTIMDERFVASPPSYVAAGAHCLSRFILKKGDWTKAHVHYSGYTWSQLKSLVSLMLECCARPRQHHSAIFEKYGEKRFKEASIVVQEQLDAGFALPQTSFPSRTMRQPPQQIEDLSEPFYYSSGLLVPIEG